MLITRHICFTRDIGVNGNLFGGKLLEWVDEAAAIHASLIIKGLNVIANISNIAFKYPVKVGDILQFHSEEVSKGNSSLKIHIWVTKEAKRVCECDAIFVHVDHKGRSKKIDWNKEVLVGDNSKVLPRWKAGYTEWERK